MNIQLNENYSLLCSHMPKESVLNNILLLAESSKEDIVSLDYFLRRNSIKKHITQFINSYSVLHTYTSPPYLIVNNKHIQEGLDTHNTICQALLVGASVRHVHSPFGISDGIEIPEDFPKVCGNYCKKLHGENLIWASKYREGQLVNGSEIHVRLKEREKTLVVIISSTLEKLRMCLSSLKLSGTEACDVVVGWYGKPEMTNKLKPMIKNLMEEFGVRLVYVDGKGRFNYSAINNLLVEEFLEESHRYILLLNDDVYVDANFIDGLQYVSSRESAAVVGAALFYPWTEEANRTYQHGGIYLGSHKEPFCHSNCGLKVEHNFLPTREVSAVTFAATLIESEVYQELRLDERFYGDCNDVEFCLRVRESGLSIWYSSLATGVHEESATRKNDPEMQGDTSSIRFYYENLQRLRKEFIYL